MKLSQFKFYLPPELIAQEPRKYRDESRLMVIHRDTQSIEHKQFKDILNYFDDQDVMIANNTKVFPARLPGIKEKTGAKIEVFLLRELDKESYLWDVLVDPARKIRIGNKLYFGENHDLIAEVIDNTTSRGRTIRFIFDGEYDEFKETLHRLGETPLPRIHDREVTEEDDERYQSIFAKVEGAVAAPTAHLHFSRELLKRFELKGINLTQLTLHAGLGNFDNIEVEDLSKHKPESEEIHISQETVDFVNTAKSTGHHICAIGTTTLKALESAVTLSGNLIKFDGWTNKFIYPPYTYRIPTALITNFHLPKSKMLMMATAFGGYDFVMRAYKEAVEKEYRFFTYGDAMLIL
jgi:S-adenosylmethionine:tRNA ribosyltransferase-isomerase